MPKPPAELTIPQAHEVRPCPQNVVLQSPVTPVSAEGLISLQNIIRQDAHALDETSKQRLQRHLQKLAKAAQLSFARGALQQNQIRLLTTVNNEAKVRRSTKSVVLAKAEGEAKVMSYKELEEARTKRAEQDAVKEKRKGRRGQKPKIAAAETVDGNAVKSKRGRKRKGAASELEEEVDSEPKKKKARTLEPPESWKAPVAHIYD